MEPKRFYEHLWSTKRKVDYDTRSKRDWFHRVFLDRMFDPYANPRSDVAIQMLEKGERLLDIGCWDGRFLDKINALSIYKNLYGIDIVPDGVQIARSKGYEAIVVDLNSGQIPYPASFFDAVTIMAVLEHVFDPFSIIREIHRVLRSNGILIIDVPNVGSLSNRIRLLFGRVPVTSTDPGWDGGHLHYFTKHALDHFLYLEGFDVLARKTTGGSPHLRQLWISLLGGELLYKCRRKFD